MQPFPISEDEVKRLKALRSLHILDGLPEGRFDIISRISQHLFDIDTEDLSGILQDLSVIVEHHSDSVCLNKVLEKVEKLQGALKEKELFYKAIANHITDCVFVTDSEWNIQSMNASAEKRIGYPSSACVGKNINIIFPKYAQKDLTFMVNKDCDEVVEVSCEKKDGSLFTGELMGKCLTFEDEKIYIWILRATADGTESVAERKEFISDASFMLRTPMAAIQGALGLVLGVFSENLTNEAVQHLEEAYEQCHELLRISNNIMEILKKQAGMVSLRLEKVNVRTIAENAIKTNLRFAKEKDIDLTLENNLSDHFAYADHARLDQVITFLIFNTIQHSAAKSSIVLSLESLEGKLRVNLVDKDSKISVDDQGEIIQKVVEKSESQVLGPSITKALVEKLGGKIAFERGKGDGTNFQIVLDSV